MMVFSDTTFSHVVMYFYFFNYPNIMRDLH
jgi:hypothetical protein